MARSTCWPAQVMEKNVIPVSTELRTIKVMMMRINRPKPASRSSFVISPAPVDGAGKSPRVSTAFNVRWVKFKSASGLANQQLVSVLAEEDDAPGKLPKVFAAAGTR